MKGILSGVAWSIYKARCENDEKREWLVSGVLRSV